MTHNTLRRKIEEKDKAVQERIAQIVPAAKSAPNISVRRAITYVETTLMEVRLKIDDLKNGNGKTPRPA